MDSEALLLFPDVNNVLVERYAYDVFGRPTIRDPNGVVIAASALGNPYLFTGRAYDAESGLYYYRARYYDYATGRFLQPDPTGYADGLNLYSYCGNNPFNFLDPSGLCKESLFDRIDRVMDVVGPYALPVTLSCLTILCPPAGLAILGFMGGMDIGEALFTGTDLYGNPLSTSQRVYRGAVGTLEIALASAGAAQMPAAKVASKTPKGLITGRAHASGIHKLRTYREAIEMAKSGQYKHIYLNKSLSTTTGGGIDSSLKPDIAGVLENGQIDIVEVLSPSQSFDSQVNKIAYMRDLLGPRAGRGDVVIPH